MKNIKCILASVFSLLITISLFAAPKQWHGFKCSEFVFEGRAGAFVEPDNPRKDGAWIWKPAFWGAFPDFDIEMLKRGYRFVYCNFTHDYANPKSIEAGGRFVDFAVREFNLSNKVSIEGMSRGGAYTLCFANRFPEKVAAVYVDAPVCDFSIWPGSKDAKLRADYFAKHNKADDGKFESSPIYNYKNLAKSGVPVWSVCGDADKTVSIEKNFYVYRKLLEDAGGISMLTVKNGCGHHPHGLKDPSPSADFVDRRQPSYMAKQYINLRENFGASLEKFKTTRTGRVGFVGGSVAETKALCNMAKDDLQRRFPFTQFEFVESGINATDATFRIENDIISKGKVDLLFIDISANGVGDTQIRGFEGEIRNILEANPSCDVVLMYSFTIPTQNNRSIRAIEIVETVANHYKIVSIDLAKEIKQRMNDGEFDCRLDNAYCSSLANKLCAAAIANMFDAAQTRNRNSPKKTPYLLPKK